MNDGQAMRASDRDREQAIDRLRTAMEDGRLTTDEYVDRVGLAYQATTYGELEPLLADLPAAVPVRARDTAELAPAPVGRTPRACALARMPTVLRVLWVFWFVAVSINVVVWALVSLTAARFAYPWPLWVAGPYGAALFAVSAIAVSMRRTAL
jgi:Domain of unknown function (DUF1707)